MFKHALVFSIIVAIQVTDIVFSESPKSYGEFSLKILQFDVCKGPKKANCANLVANVKNDTAVTMTLTIDEDVIPNRGKIVSLMNDKPLVRLQMKKPCDHLFMKPLFQAILNVTQNCEFKKGKHIIHVDLEEVAQKYYGGMFLFGNMTFKSLFYNDRCNFSCAITQVNFSPKKNKKN